jgi:hypothetical protein
MAQAVEAQRSTSPVLIDKITASTDHAIEAIDFDAKGIIDVGIIRRIDNAVAVFDDISRVAGGAVAVYDAFAERIVRDADS